MGPISFSGMEDAITVDKPNGTHVSYHIFEESEIHLNRITPASTQEWHYHTLIDECLLITMGVLTCLLLPLAQLRFPWRQTKIIILRRGI